MYKKMIRMTDRRLLANTKVNAEFKIGFYKPGFTITSKFWSKNNILNDILYKTLRICIEISSSYNKTLETYNKAKVFIKII